MTHTILLVHSENVAWQGLQEALAPERRGELQLLSDFRDAASALAAVAARCPDAVLTGAPLPDMPLLPFLAAVNDACPRTRVVVLPDDPALLTEPELVGLATSGVAGGLLWSDVTRATVDHWLATVLDGLKVHSGAVITAVLAAQQRLLTAGAMFPPLRLLLADPNPVARAGLKTLLAADASFAVAGEAIDDVVASVHRTQPDLIVVDPARHGALDIQLLAALKQAVPQTRLCIYTGVFDPRSYLQAMTGGASGYLLKGTADDEVLLLALELIGRFGAVVTGRAVAERYPGPVTARQYIAVPEPSAPELSARELAILHGVVTGVTQERIAELEGISVRTVERTVEFLQRKLHVSTATKLVAKAALLGFIPWEWVA